MDQEDTARGHRLRSSHGHDERHLLRGDLAAAARDDRLPGVPGAGRGRAGDRPRMAAARGCDPRPSRRRLHLRARGGPGRSRPEDRRPARIGRRCRLGRLHSPGKTRGLGRRGHRFPCGGHGRRCARLCAPRRGNGGRHPRLADCRCHGAGSRRAVDRGALRARAGGAQTTRHGCLRAPVLPHAGRVIARGGGRAASAAQCMGDDRAGARLRGRRPDGGDRRPGSVSAEPCPRLACAVRRERHSRTRSTVPPPTSFEKVDLDEVGCGRCEGRCATGEGEAGPAPREIRCRGSPAARGPAAPGAPPRPTRAWRSPQLRRPRSRWRGRRARGAPAPPPREPEPAR